MAGMIARVRDILRPEGREPLVHRRPSAAKSSSERRQDIPGNNKSTIGARLFGARAEDDAATLANNNSDKMRKEQRHCCRTPVSIAPRLSLGRTTNTRDQIERPIMSGVPGLRFRDLAVERGIDVLEPLPGIR